MQRAWEDRVEKRKDLGGPESPRRGGQGREPEMKARNGKRGQKAEWEVRKGSPSRVAGEEGNGKNKEGEGRGGLVLAPWSQRQDPTRLFPFISHLGKQDEEAAYSISYSGWVQVLSHPPTWPSQARELHPSLQ